MQERTIRAPLPAQMAVAAGALGVVVLLTALALGGGRATGRSSNLAQGRADRPAAGSRPDGTAVASPTPSPRAQHPATPNIDLYRGLGSWVDIYERTSFEDPERAVAGMRQHGVRTLYIETSNYRREEAIKYPAKQARFIEAAHRKGMKVVAWYLPGFRDIRKDFWRTMKAVDFRTPSGQGFDSFALDIESPEVRNPYVRTRRLMQLSDRIRAAVGPSYSLGAIIPSPKGMHDNPTYWPGFPYKALAQDYDVFVPMTYFTWRVSGQAGVHNYTTAVVQLIRHGVGIRGVPIHVIGGISDDSTQDEARGFVHALREQGVIGGSYYAFHGTTRHLWWQLERLPANPVQATPLPVRVGYDRPLGNLPGGDRAHPKDVVFQAGPASGSRVLHFQAFDVQRGEVTLRVNWHPVKVLQPTSSGAWSGEVSAAVPGRWLNRSGPNFISFTARGRYPQWRTWGVRTLALGRK